MNNIIINHSHNNRNCKKFTINLRTSGNTVTQNDTNATTRSSIAGNEKSRKLSFECPWSLLKTDVVRQGIPLADGVEMECHTSSLADAPWENISARLYGSTSPKLVAANQIHGVQKSGRLAAVNHPVQKNETLQPNFG